jgi:RNA polymerase sigma factor (TIGR02999 family)
MSEVTRILKAMEQGDPHAADQLLPLVYDELRKLAAQKLAHDKPGQTLDATALVHEAYLRLVASPGQASPGREPGDSPHWNSRGHFFAAAAEAMRRILVEQARRRTAAKRGGAARREDRDASELAAPAADAHLLAVHEALDALAQTDAEAATLVKLRFFGGMTMTEAAEALGVSVRKAQDIWAYARSWLHRAMRSE